MKMKRSSVVNCDSCSITYFSTNPENFSPHLMKQTALFILLVFTSIYSSGQERKLLSFDLISKKADTLELTGFDTLLLHEKTPYNTGTYNNIHETLNLLPPSENIFEGTRFTIKKQASKDYDINNFPIRTSIKLFMWENDSLKNLCSGSIISRKHVLTACHCVAKINKDSLVYDSLFVCPVFDNGEVNTNFDCSWVKRIYFFENWTIADSDFSVLELENPIGENTGWLSIGFDANDSSLLDGIYYKFSYPSLTIPELDPNNYNGDTLYYNYGIADIASNHLFGISGTKGIPGESGSSLIKIENQNSYTSYGVLSYSHNLLHNRLTNWKYYAFKSVIINDLELYTSIIGKNDNVSIFPNPTANYLNIICPEEHSLNKIVLYDLMGKKVLEKTNLAKKTRIDISELNRGQYILIGHTDNTIIVEKVIKHSR